MSEHSSNQQTQKHEILNENLWKVAVKLSWPAVIAMVLYGLNTVFDAIFVGKFIGETALAGVSIVYPLSQVTLGIGSLIGVGAGSALSIAIGAGDKDTQRKLLGNVNYMSIASALLFTGIAWMLAPFLVKMMGGDVNTSPYGLEYFRVTVIGSFFWIIGLAYNMIVRAEGKMKSAASMMAGGLIINIVANYVFIAILGFGVKGAAWGTNIGMIIYTISGLLYFKGSRVTFEANPFQLSVDKDIQKSILSMGMSSFIMAFMSLVQGLVVLNALSRYGSTMDIAFYGAAYRLFTFLLTPIFGFMRALQPVVGINYGAKQYQRVIESFKVFCTFSHDYDYSILAYTNDFSNIGTGINSKRRCTTGHRYNEFQNFYGSSSCLTNSVYVYDFLPCNQQRQSRCYDGYWQTTYILCASYVNFT